MTRGDNRELVIEADREPVSVPVSSEGKSAESVEEMLSLMRQGDRVAAARFLEGYGPMIRRRARGKLGARMRRLFDSQEILSTVSRRLDRYVSAGRLEASSTSQLWALVFKMVDAALVDKWRIFQRLKTVEDEDSGFARQWLGRLEESNRRNSDAAEIDLELALSSLKSDVDRQILSLWLAGMAHPVIAEYTDLTPDAVRQRWHGIRGRLAGMLERGEI